MAINRMVFPAGVLLSLMLSSPCSADTYAFEEMIENAVPKSAPPAWKEKSKSTVTVRMGHDAMEVETNSARVIFDFQHNAMYGLDMAQHRYTKGSLFAIVAFKASELQNRYMLGDLLTKSGAKSGGMDRFLSECELGLMGPTLNSGYKPNKTQKNGSTIYQHAGQTVASFQPAPGALSGEKMAQFSRFLIHSTQIHPAIRKDIEQEGKQPKQLMWIFKSPADEQRKTLTLKKFDNTEYRVAIPVDCKPYVPTDDPLAPVMARLKELGEKPDPAKMKADAIKAINGFLQKQDTVDAVLALSEYSLATGDYSPGVNLKDANKSSPDYALLINGLDNPTSEADAIRKLESLDKIDRSKYPKSYLLDLFRANLLVSLSESKTKVKTPHESNPVKAFVNVLKVNPYLAGAYHDLGGVFYSSFRMDWAWECYDQARKLAPNHPLLKEVNEMEKSIRKQLPEFFEGDKLTASK